MSSRAVNTHEIEANAFAAELLMPRHLLLAELHDRMPKSGAADPSRLTKQLAATFDVSEQAMEIRLANLGLTTSFLEHPRRSKTRVAPRAALTSAETNALG